MPGDLNKGFSLFLFHLVGEFSHTEAKHLFLPPMYSAILAAFLKAWLLSDIIVPTDLPCVVFVLQCSVSSKCNGYLCSFVCCSNRSPRDTVKNHFIREERKKKRVKWTNLPKLESGCCVCSEHLATDCFEVSYRHELFCASSRKRVLKTDVLKSLFLHK